MSLKPNEIIDTIRAAISNLPCLAGTEHLTEEFTRIIVSMAQNSQPISALIDLRKTNENGIERDLRAIRSQASKLKTLIAAIRPMTKERLWDAPSFVDRNGRQVRVDVNRLLSSLSEDLMLLGKVAEITKSATENRGRTRGRTDDLRSAAATKMAAIYYQKITAHKANRSKADDGFLVFLQTVFNVLSIERNVDRATKDYLGTLRT